MSLRDAQRGLGALLEVDLQIDRRRQQIAALDPGTTLAARYKVSKPNADTLRAEANTLAAVQKDTELTLAGIDTKIKAATDKLYSGKVTSPRELEDLQAGIDALGRQKATLEDELLIHMEAAATADKAAKAAELDVAKITRAYRTLKDTNTKREAELLAEIKAMEPMRKPLVNSIADKAVVKQYELIRERKGGAGAAFMTWDRTCTSCGMMVNGTTVNAVTDGLVLATCEHCSRILLPG
jgi:predicted  nucleic acid-binding Zn-ribbon protein